MSFYEYDNAQVRELLKDMIGSPYDEAVRRDAEQRTGRAVRPSGKFPTTKDFWPNRVNLHVGEDDIVESIQFG